MGTKNRSSKDVLQDAQSTLDTAFYGFKILVNGSPTEKLAGLRNLVVFGRAVTNVLQNLRATEPAFDIWYEKYKVEMKSDPLMKYFYELRSKILKQGSLGVGVYTYIRQMNLPDDLRHFGPPPPYAMSFFIGDNLGGTGWIVQLPDGSTEKYYVNLPSDIGSVNFLFHDPPSSHMGKELKNKTVESLAILYLDYLKRLVEDAKSRFGQQR